ncbi:hypothetical protein ONZ51_g6714 [Trametes cubensis]|uniref:Uncharacterized protein n=1 Tax=Trametes cubensis TaxID=1111947 RepID=A0AAD7XCE8_9APHY|nr:hypothetical protein ONZ51_g6714 [Trametes cubensis]
MEERRRQFAQNAALYPDLIPLGRQARQAPSSTSSRPSPATSSARPIPTTGSARPNPAKAALPSSQGLPSSPQSIISVSSNDSPQPPKTYRQAPIEISSDEDDVPRPVPPLRPKPQNDARPMQSSSQQSKPSFGSRPPVPIAIPTNKAIPRPAPAYAHLEQEAIDIDRIGPVDDRFMTQADTEKALRDFVNEGYNDGDNDYNPEDAIVEGFRDGIRLLPHQIKSRQWMADRESGKKTGGILADDMGLGKTISTLTRVLEGRPTKKDKAAGYSGSTLVVCPVALVSQWESEVKKYTSGLRVIQHHGGTRTSDPSELERAHIVVTSYSVVTSEYGAYLKSTGKDESKPKGKKKGKDSDSEDSDSDSVTRRLKAAPKRGKAKDALFNVKWWRVVLDEAHNIKNRNTKAAIACCALEAKFRWCLTGTPMQNNVEEIYSLIKFLRIVPLNDWQTFNSSVAKPIKAGRPVRALKRLQVVLQKIMLRRTKTTVINGKPILELPDRLVNVVNCEFDADERAFYHSVEEKVNTSLEQLQQGDINKAYTSVLVLLLPCNHPGLISKDYKKDEDAVEPKSASQNDNEDDGDELAGMLAGLAITRKPCQVCQTPLTADNTWKDDVCVDCEDVYKAGRRKLEDPNSDLPPHSSKTRKIMEILRETEARGEGEKTIIFSQFTSMLDLIEPFLRKERIKFVRYDGSMNKVQRDEALAKINESASTRVILISFKAGSTGLNLTCCNNVILVDPWWNPALEDQAFDRAHRFGQKRAVNIHKLCVPDSVEQRILELQEKKRALAAAALSGDKFKNMRLGIDDLVALFRTDGHDDDED